MSVAIETSSLDSKLDPGSKTFHDSDFFISTNRNGIAWDAVVRATLDYWRSHPEELEDDDFDPPSPSALEIARLVVHGLRESGMHAPASIVPAATGGVAIKFNSPDGYWTCEISNDETIEVIAYRGCEVMYRKAV